MDSSGSSSGRQQRGSVVVNSVEEDPVSDMPPQEIESVLGLTRSHSIKEHSRSEASNVFVWITALVATLGSFQFGFTTAIVNGAQADIAAQFNMGDTQVGLIASLILLGAMLGTTLVSPIGKFAGPRTILATVPNILIVGGALLCSEAVSDIMIYIGRFITGLGVGIFSVVVPQYLSEVSPAAIRGTITTLHQFGVTLGIVFSYVAGYAFQDVSQSWRWMLRSQVVASALMLVLMPFFPESPRHLVSAGNINAAHFSLERLRKTPMVEEELNLMRESIQSQQHATDSKAASYREIFTVHRFPLLIGVAIMVLQQWTGINAIIFFSNTIFESAGVENPSLMSIYLGLLNMVVTMFSVWLMDISGRRTLLLVSFAVMAVALIATALSFLLPVSATFAVVFVFVFIPGFAIGLGSVPWIFVSEIYNDRIRSQSMSICLFVNWTSNFILALLFKSLPGWLGNGQKGLGEGIVFIIFGALATLGVLFTFRFVPETKGRTFEEIHTSLYKPQQRPLLG